MLPQYQNDRYDLLSSFIFTALLASFGVLFFGIHKAKASAVEARPLAVLPQFSTEAVFFGNYLDSLNFYVADHFPFRESFVAFSFKLKSWRGYPSKEVGFYAGGINVDEGIDAFAEGDSTGQPANDRDMNVMQNAGNIDDVGQLSRGLLIYEGMAIQMFGGGRKTAISAALAMNQVVAKLPEGVQMYVGVTPTHGEFYLPAGYDKNYNSERKNIDTLYTYLDPRIKSFDICYELHKHKNEYIFFNTDHHWTGTGAYYAHVALCKVAGLQPIPMALMETKAIPNFLGSLYRQTRDRRLQENPDSVVYHKIPNLYKAYRLSGEGYGNKSATQLYVESAKGGNAYGVFLGGDVPAMCIESDVKNGRTALLIKNSYGNALAPFLPAYFERTFVIDYRYFQSNLLDFIEKNKITDFIVFHNSFSANTPSHVSMMTTLCTAKPRNVRPIAQTPVTPPPPPAPSDTLKKK